MNENYVSEEEKLKDAPDDWVAPEESARNSRAGRSSAKDLV